MVLTILSHNKSRHYWLLVSFVPSIIQISSICEKGNVDPELRLKLRFFLIVFYECAWYHKKFADKTNFCVIIPNEFKLTHCRWSLKIYSQMPMMVWVPHFLCSPKNKLKNERKIVKNKITPKQPFYWGGFPLGEMTGGFATKSRRNYFATKLYIIFTWITLTQLLKTSKIRLLNYFWKC